MQNKPIRKILSLIFIFNLIFQQSGFAQMIGQVDIAKYLNQMKSFSVQDKFRPLHLRYFSYDALTNNFEILLDKGDLKDIKDYQLKEQGQELLEYFLIGITLPDENFWVNLRPDSESQIIDRELAQTDVGKILLEADLQLKKDTATFTSPETPEGRAYWNKLYQKAGQLFEGDNVTIPTLTRPWIVPQEVIIRESADSAYVYKATLKVMLEQDHLKNSADYNFKDERLKELNEYSSQLIRENIIPKLTKEVNTSKKYASLRQVFYSLILSRWFKARFSGKSGLYPELINKHNLNGLTSQEPWSKSTFFKEYQKSFQNGEYNIKEAVTTLTGGQVIRSYFSGGIKLTGDLNIPQPGQAASPIIAGLRGINPFVDEAFRRGHHIVGFSGRPREGSHLSDLREARPRPRATSSPLEAGDTGSLKIMPGTSMWLFAPSGNIPEDLRRLKAEADEQTGEAFVKNRAFEFIPGQISFSAEGKPDSATQKRITEFISGWKKTRAQDENLNQVLPDEEKALTKDIITSLRFVKQIISEIKDPVVRARLESETRFVLTVPRAKPNTEQVDLMEKELGISPPVLYFYGPSFDKDGKITSLYYGEDAPGISSEDGRLEVSVLGFGGRHPYKDFEAKTSTEAPSSLYIPLSRVKRYAQLLDETKTTGSQENGQRIVNGFSSWLISTHSRISTNDFTISAEDEQNILFAERLAYELFKKERQTYLELLAKTHQNRTREYKLDVELLRWLSADFIPTELEDAVTQVLSNAQDKGEIAGFLVTRTGDDLSIWISHKRSTQDNSIPQLAKNAVLASLAKAKEMGIFKAPTGEPDVSGADINKGDFDKGLRWRSGNVVYTIREGAEPTLRVKYFGGARKAVDLGMLELYASIAKTTMGTIEGIPGWYYVSEKIEDLRQGNPEVQGTMLRYPNDTDHLALQLRDEDWAYSAIFPGKQARIRMDEPVAFVFLDSNYVEGEDQVANPDLRPFSPWIWVAQHSGKEAKGATEGVLLEPKIIPGPDTFRSIQTMKLGEAPQATWARIKDQPIAVAIGIESLMTETGGYDGIDVVDMLGKTTEYEDLQPLRDRLADLLRRQGPFQYGLTTRFADMQGDRTWEKLEERARSASSPLVTKIGNVKLGIPEVLPDRKKGELPRHWDYTRDHQLFTGTIKKGDIGGEGHGSPYPTYEPTTEANFREITQRPGTHLRDFITFAIGDDLQLLMLHQLGPLNDLIGQYAWEGFWRAGWIVKALVRQPYAFMQDAPGAKDKNARDEAQPNDAFMEVLQAELRTWAQEPGVQAYLKLNHLDVEEVIRQLLAEYRNPQKVKPKAIGGVVQLAGNLIGSGFGNADLVVTPWLYEKTQGKFMAFGFDKTSPAVYNSIVLGAARRAIAQGEFRNIYIDVQNVHNDRHMLLDVNNSFDTLLKSLGNSSRYQIGDIFTNDEEDNLHQLGAFTTDRLFQVLLALTGKSLYGGKDDPESLVAWSFGKYMIEVARDIGYYQVLGNERGSNIRLVRWTPVKRPYLGQYSDPTAAALLFSVDRNGKIIPQPDGSKFVDLFDTPAFANLRREVKDTQTLIKAMQGTIGPGTAADLKLLELAYPAAANREILLADPARKWPIRTGRVIARQHNPATASQASSPLENGKYVRTLQFLNSGKEPVGLHTFLSKQHPGLLRDYGQWKDGKFQPADSVTLSLLPAGVKDDDKAISLTPVLLDTSMISPGAQLILKQDLLVFTGAKAVPEAEAFQLEGVGNLLTFEKPLSAEAWPRTQLGQKPLSEDTMRELKPKILEAIAQLYKEFTVSLGMEKVTVIRNVEGLAWVREVVLVGPKQQITMRVGVQAKQLDFMPGHLLGIEYQLKRAIESAMADYYREAETRRQTTASEDTANPKQGDVTTASSPVGLVETKRKLNNLREHLVLLQHIHGDDTIVNFGKFWSERLPEELEPRGFALNAGLTLYDLEEEIKSGKIKPDFTGSIVEARPGISAHIIPWIPYIIRAVAPSKEFADEAIAFWERSEDKSGSAASPVRAQEVGGIDFRVINMITQPMGNFSGLNFTLPKISHLEDINLDEELESIQKMLKAGIMPSGERLKEYVAACYQKGAQAQHIDGIITALVDICRMQEEEISVTPDDIKALLLVVDSR